MGVYVKGKEMPKSCSDCPMLDWDLDYIKCKVTGRHFKVKEEPFAARRVDDCPLVPVPPHGDLIDRDALIKDGWLHLYKEVMRMGGYAIHELPLKNPSIPVIIPAEEGE